MSDYIIDTNVLLVASLTFKDSDVPPAQRQIVLDWLIAFRKDGQNKLVLDQSFRIWREYLNQLTGQDIGLMVVTEKMQKMQLRLVDVAYGDDGIACLPAELEKVIHDLSDRKLVAAALVDLSTGGQSRIANASEGDWYDWEKELKDAGVHVEHLLDDWKRPKWKEKQKRRSKKITR